MDANDQANLNDGGNNDQNNDGSNTPPAWTAQLDKDLQTNERLTQFKTIGEMGKTFLDLEEKNKSALYIPGDKATDEEKAAFHAKLGRPEAADKYSFTKPADLPESIPYQPEVEQAFKQFAFDNGLSDSQAGKIHEWYYGLVKQGHDMQQKTEQQATETAINALKDEWKGDTFKENTELAARTFRKFGGDEARDFIDNTKINGVALGDYPIFNKVFAAIGKVISGDTINSGREGHNNDGLSDEDKAKARFPNTYK